MSAGSGAAHAASSVAHVGVVAARRVSSRCHSGSCSSADGVGGAARAHNGVLQTIPGIALLAFMIPLLGIGTVPALVALFIYSLYPIVRNTYSGVRDADPVAVNAGHALGMTAGQVLRHVRLPLAAPTIMAGVRTAAVDQRRDGDARGIHWRGRTRRADRHGSRAFGYGDDPERGDPGGASRATRGFRLGDL